MPDTADNKMLLGIIGIVAVVGIIGLFAYLAHLRALAASSVQPLSSSLSQPYPYPYMPMPPSFSIPPVQTESIPTGQMKLQPTIGPKIRAGSSKNILTTEEDKVRQQIFGMI